MTPCNVHRFLCLSCRNWMSLGTPPNVQKTLGFLNKHEGHPLMLLRPGNELFTEGGTGSFSSIEEVVGAVPTASGTQYPLVEQDDE